MSDGNLGQTHVLRSCVATRPFRGLGFVEERTRGIHQGWKVAVLSEKAEYMSATEPFLIVLNNHRASIITVQRRGGPYMSQLCTSWGFSYAFPLIVQWKRGGMIEFKGSQFERE